MLLIMGCTACGKSSLAYELAKRTGGEIISIDSMKVYRRMDIGTAKPPLENRQEIVHHLVDVVEPSESFGIGLYLELADQAIDQIKQKGRPIIAVGGTAMYIRGLLEGIFEGPPAHPEIRKQHARIAEEQGNGELHNQLLKVDPQGAERIHPNDFKRISRALEVYELTGKPISSFQTQFRSGNYKYDWKLIGLRRDKDENNHRINMRIKKMVENGLIDEVKSLLAEPNGLSDQAAQAVGYAEIINHFNGQMTRDEAIERIKINTRRFAKSQRTWFRSFADVNRYDITEEDTAEGVADQVIKDFNL
ncbi:MAG: tRNA (adenosine(37)-N6)-dimethylallyltransferase MiaA [Phycisphaerae bacterium]|nr:tRNA (adenosine(37)-N6)-dimethylallyltransferase MiaA [Phycisphaerae bacterium]